MRETKSRHAPQVQEVAAYAAEHAVDLRPIDVSSQESCNAAIEEIISTARRLDVVVHNAGHMAFWQATVSGAYRPDAGQRGSRECVSDRVRAELLRRIGLGDLLVPRAYRASLARD